MMAMVRTTYVPIEWEAIDSGVAWALRVVESNRTWMAVGVLADFLAFWAYQSTWKGRARSPLIAYCGAFAAALSLHVWASVVLAARLSVQFSGFEGGIVAYRRYNWFDVIPEVATVVFLFAPLLILACAFIRRAVLVSRCRRRICPFCRYDLRASPGGRCPECGRSSDELPFLRPRLEPAGPVKS